MRELYDRSTLPYGPDERAIRELLLNCLEEHYGDLSSVIVSPERAVVGLREMAEVINRYRDLVE